jgi:flagellar biosynthesis/type III secretory pathway chaperone
MKLDPKVLKALETSLDEELRQYHDYLQILEQEQERVVTLKTDELVEFSATRSTIIDRLSQLRDVRVGIVASLVGNDSTKLSDFVESLPFSADKTRLSNYVEKIKSAVQSVDKKTKEFNQVLSYSLGLVNGEISLLWSASQTVSRVYNAFGSVVEGAQPAPQRVGSLLGEA